MIRGGLVMLRVRDIDRAVRFYVETLGMKLVEDVGDRAVIDAGEGFRIGLVRGDRRSEPKGPEAFGPSIAFCPKVPIAEALSILENRGIDFQVRGDGPGTCAYFCDLDDNVLCLVRTSNL